MKKIILTLPFLVFLLTSTHANDVITGAAQTGDGDDLVIEGQRIRLQGVDAPEWKQPCELNDGSEFFPGREAKAWLESIISNQIVSCDIETTDRYNRKIGTCYVQGKNLNQMLVQEGFAFTNARYTERYIEFEKEARADKKGLWRGKCEKPWDWRKKNPR